jgi:hypothetical protein
VAAERVLNSLFGLSRLKCVRFLEVDPQTLSQIHMLLLDGFANGAAVSEMTIDCGVVAFVSLKNPIFTGIGIHGLRVS